MTTRPDIAVLDATGQPILVVEVKNKLGTDTEWATKMRRNLLANGFVPHSRYFLLALPDRFYIWHGKQLPELEAPTYEFDPAPLLNPYTEAVDAPLHHLTGAGFELVVRAWLSEVIRSNEIVPEETAAAQWLLESGLFDAVKRGHVVSEIAA